MSRPRFFDCADCDEAFHDPAVAAAMVRATVELLTGVITQEQFEAWLWNIVHMPVILCPHCGDWQDVEDSPQIIAYGRYWCCTMCELSGRGPVENFRGGPDETP